MGMSCPVVVGVLCEQLGVVANKVGSIATGHGAKYLLVASGVCGYVAATAIALKVEYLGGSERLEHSLYVSAILDRGVHVVVLCGGLGCLTECQVTTRCQTGNRDVYRNRHRGSKKGPTRRGRFGLPL